MTISKTQMEISNTKIKQLAEMIPTTNVYDVAEVSALTLAKRLSSRYGNQLWLKREDQQSVFSFKLRGAYNKISNLSEEQLQAGVIAASAGNHAQGVALAAQRLKIKAQIVMPTTTPRIKVESVRAMGAAVVLYGDNYHEACGHALELAAKSTQTFIHPYDDMAVMAGQGTVAKEILEQFKSPIDAVFIPVGGGGLIAGMSAWLRTHAPETKIIGVEPEDAATLHAAMAAQERVVLEQVGIFADGVAVKQIGQNTFDVARETVDEVILVSTDDMCAAIHDIFDDTRVLSEPAGALAVAGMKKYIVRENCKNQNLVAVNSGANVNFDRLRHVVERSEIGEGREGLFAVTIPEEKGSFLRFCSIIGKCSISEFNYRYSTASEAHIFLGVKFEQAQKEKIAMIEKLQLNGYAVVDISDNEMAKLHLRHLVGGHSPELEEEFLVRFEFPERPGALLQFLEGMGARWNISLFHYRNHGSAYGRVLVGAQVAEQDRDEFRAFLDGLGYRYHEESENPAYPLFLR